MQEEGRHKGEAGKTGGKKFPVVADIPRILSGEGE